MALGVQEVFTNCNTNGQVEGKFLPFSYHIGKGGMDVHGELFWFLKQGRLTQTQTRHRIGRHRPQSRRRCWRCALMGRFRRALVTGNRLLAWMAGGRVWKAEGIEGMRGFEGSSRFKTIFCNVVAWRWVFASFSDKIYRGKHRISNLFTVFLRRGNSVLLAHMP